MKDLSVGLLLAVALGMVIVGFLAGGVAGGIVVTGVVLLIVAVAKVLPAATRHRT